MCLYSFIVPVYNVKREYLEKCVDSIVDNKNQNIEIILVDDCSTNGCELLCDEIAYRDTRVKVIHQEKNIGVSEARNTGIKASRGDWIVFVDSDDWVDDNTCIELSQITDAETDIVIFSAYRESVNATQPFGTAEKIDCYTKIDADDSQSESVDVLSDKLLKQSLNSTHEKFETIKYCWGKAFRREFLLEKNIEFPNISYCEDIVFMADAFRKAYKVVQIPDRLYHYRVSATSTVNSYRHNAIFEQRKFLEILSGKISDKNNDTIYYAALLSMQICITRCLYNRENRMSILKKHIKARSVFSEWPYKDVFKHIHCADMKRKEKVKALLIKNHLYFLYYIGTEKRRTSVAGFE